MKNLLLLVLVLFTYSASAQSFDEVKITKNWKSKIEDIAPAKARIKAPKRKLLVFSQHTGFYHWTIPHNDEMLKILAQKTGAFDVFIGHDIESFSASNLKKYDAVVFNNCNPAGPDRDLFTQLIKNNSSLSEDEVKALANEYEKGFMNYIKSGGGLMIMHGALTVQNNSEEFSKLTGGSFDYHPKQQEIHLIEVDKAHPMVQAFNGNGFTHVDEPYFFKNAYWDYNFRPLLYAEVDKIEGQRKEFNSDIVYLAWIKKYGKGRVFYSSPSHNAQSFEQPELLQFFLDGIQYVTGDLKCDDSPIGKP
ncbi:ThuA domain-containing protein [Jiulongibacter sp. NS-SX5]|uniref:ThuA domain-containing protein n=1 Tax=Jiulongibacter sp. NS-SX5 TaxID=3463854 RepID=UPI0040588739